MPILCEFIKILTFNWEFLWQKTITLYQLVKGFKENLRLLTCINNLNDVFRRHGTHTEHV